MSTRRKYLIVALLVGAAVVGSTAFAVVGIRQSAPFPFRSVRPAELARGGVKVTAATPPADLPTTAAEAVTAVRELQGRRALEVRYVRCVDTLKTPRLDQNCWAVSIDPHGLITPGSAKTRWDLAFVDATSGRVIEARLGS